MEASSNEALWKSLSSGMVDMVIRYRKAFSLNLDVLKIQSDDDAKELEH